MPTEGLRRWISVKDAAEYLGCHLQTAYSWIAEGKLRSARIGRSVRVDLRALEAQLEGQASATSPAAGKKRTA